MTTEHKPHSDQEFLYAFIDGAEPGWDASVRYDAHEKVRRLFEQYEAVRQANEVLKDEAVERFERLEAARTKLGWYEEWEHAANRLQSVYDDECAAHERLKEQYEALRGRVTEALAVIDAWENNQEPHLDRFFECDADFLEAVQQILAISTPTSEPDDSGLTPIETRWEILGPGKASPASKESNPASEPEGA